MEYKTGKSAIASENDTTASIRDRSDWSRSLAKQSQLAGIISLVAGLFVVASLWWSYTHLRSTMLRLQNVQHEIQATNAELASKEASVKELDSRLTSQRKEINAYAILLNGVSPETLNSTIKNNPQAAAQVPRISLFMSSEGQLEASKRVALKLRAKDIVIPAIELERTEKTNDRTQLRYFSRDEQTERDLQSIEASLDQSGVQVLTTFASEVSKPGQSKRRYFELWLGSDFTMPLALLSNTELRDAVLEFRSRVLKQYWSFFDLEEEISRLQSAVSQRPPGPYGPSDEARRKTDQELLAKKQAYDGMIGSITGSQIPLFNQYRAELARRLGPQTPVPPALPTAANAGSVNIFLSAIRYFDEPAKKLPI
jgi:hypothetical protein